MAKSNRQRILHGGPAQSTNSHTPSFRWSRLLGKRTVDYEELDESSQSQERPRSHTESGMPPKNSKKKGSGGTEAISVDNIGSSTESQSRASMNFPDLSLLPTRLKPYSESMHKLTQLLSALHPVLLESLAKSLEHADDVESMEHVLAENAMLRGKDQESQDMINSLNQVVGLAHRKNDGEARDLENAKLQLEEEKMEFGRERELARQRAAEQMEEQVRELAVHEEHLKRKYEVLTTKLVADCEEDKKASAERSENKMKEAARAFEKQCKQLEAERTKAENRAAFFQTRVDGLEKERDKLINESKDNSRLKVYLDAENRKLETKLEGFSSPSRPLTEYVAEFEQIERNIHDLVCEYLQNFQILVQKDLEAIHEALSRNDSLFRAVPISDSFESSHLCRAHLQRVVSANIAQTIWTPFSCDRLVGDSSLSALLLDVHERVTADSHKGSLREIFWTTQTYRALQSSRSSGLTSDTTDASVLFEGTRGTRAERAYAAIEPIVRPLIAKEKIENFSAGLMSILNASVKLWDKAMVDEKWFEAESSWESDWYSQCRSQEFDPVNEKEGGVQADAQPADNNFLMLFPRIRAWNPDFEGKKDTAHRTPGSFPVDDVGGHAVQEDRDNRKIDIVHSGSALATTSELVVMGKKEVDEEPIILEQVRNEAVEHFRDKRHRRQSSTMSASTLVASVLERE